MVGPAMTCPQSITVRPDSGKLSSAILHFPCHLLARLLKDAQSQGQTLESYLEELRASGSDAATGTAARELARIDAVNDLETAYNTLTLADPLERPTAFIAHFDASIAEETMKAFEPAVPVTSEAIVYAAVGMLIALLLLAGGETGCRGAVKKIKGY